nr:Fic family protein [Haploplasma modicum]
MKYMTTSEASIKWGISDRRIRVLLNEGRIEGAIKTGRNWMIPIDANKPVDLREKTIFDFRGLDFNFSVVDSLKTKIDSKRPLDINTSKSLRESLIVDWTYNSNAIEGSTLTLYETKVVLEGITIGGKSVVEHLEAINHKEAIIFLEELVRADSILTEWDIKSIHAIILKQINDEYAGKYRNSNVIISGASHVPPKHEQLYTLMEKLIYDFNHSWNKYHPVVQAALLHGEFVKIHPFIDGNGRTARLLLNFVLMKNGFTPVIIKNENRLTYYDSLDYAHTTKDYTNFIKLINDLVIESSNLWLSLF